MFEIIVEGLIIMFKTFLIFIQILFDKNDKINNNHNLNITQILGNIMINKQAIDLLKNNAPTNYSVSHVSDDESLSTMNVNNIQSCRNYTLKLIQRADYGNNIIDYEMLVSYGKEYVSHKMICIDDDSPIYSFHGMFDDIDSYDTNLNYVHGNDPWNVQYLYDTINKILERWDSKGFYEFKYSGINRYNRVYDIIKTEESLYDFGKTIEFRVKETTSYYTITVSKHIDDGIPYADVITSFKIDKRSANWFSDVKSIISNIRKYIMPRIV